MPPGQHTPQEVGSGLRCDGEGPCFLVGFRVCAAPKEIQCHLCNTPHEIDSQNAALGAQSTEAKPPLSFTSLKEIGLY